MKLSYALTKDSTSSNSYVILRGQHGDNDSSFINWHLFSYRETKGIESSRSRPYKKNDNSFIEQKKSTRARRVIGHLRYDTEKDLEIINGLYRNKLRLCKNFFQHIRKTKVWIGKELKDNPLMRILNTLPGLGKVLSALAALEIDNINRFRTPAKFASYSALILSTFASGGEGISWRSYS